MELIKFISQGGLLFVGALAVYLSFKYFKNKLNNKKTGSPLYNKFFFEIDFFLKNRIPYIRLNHNGIFASGRTLVFKDMLEIKFKCWDQYFKEFIIKCEGKQNISNEEILKYFMEFIDNTVDCYTRQRKNNGTPKIVIEKFNERHKQHIDVLVSGSESIIMGNSFSKKDDILNAVGYINLSTMILTITTIEQTFGDLNGELTGTKYKGKTLL